MKGVKGGAAPPPDGSQAWGPRGALEGLGASGLFGEVVEGNFSGAGGYEETRRLALKGQLPGMTGAGLGRDRERWKEVSSFRERGDGEEERMGSRGRTVGPGHSRVGVAGVKDSPPLLDFLGLWGRSGHRSDCQARGARGGGGGVEKSLPLPHLPQLSLVFDPLGASCAPLKVGIGVFPLQSQGLVGCG